MNIYEKCTLEKKILKDLLFVCYFKNNFGIEMFLSFFPKLVMICDVQIQTKGNALHKYKTSTFFFSIIDCEDN